MPKLGTESTLQMAAFLFVSQAFMQLTYSYMPQAVNCWLQLDKASAVDMLTSVSKDGTACSSVKGLLQGLLMDRERPEWLKLEAKQAMLDFTNGD